VVLAVAALVVVELPEVGSFIKNSFIDINIKNLKSFIVN